MQEGSSGPGLHQTSTGPAFPGLPAGLCQDTPDGALHGAGPQGWCRRVQAGLTGTGPQPGKEG